MDDGGRWSNGRLWTMADDGGRWRTMVDDGQADDGRRWRPMVKLTMVDDANDHNYDEQKLVLIITHQY